MDVAVMVKKKLNKEILDYLLENENVFQFTNFCIDEFRPYICKPNGNYLIDVEEVSAFGNEATDPPYEKGSKEGMYYD